MGKFYVSSLVANTTVGIEDDILNPYGIEAVLKTSNPAGLAINDEVILLADGTYSVSATDMGTGVSGGYGDDGILVRSGDATTGAPTTDRAVVDFAGQASGSYGFYINHPAWIWAFVEVKNAYNHGFGIGTSGDMTCLLGCHSHDNGDVGFYGVGGAGLVRSYYCNAYNNASNYKLPHGYATGGYVMYRCSESGAVQFGASQGYTIFSEGVACILECLFESNDAVFAVRSRIDFLSNTHKAATAGRTLFSSANLQRTLAIDNISDADKWSDVAAGYPTFWISGGNVLTGSRDADETVAADYGDEETTDPLLDADLIPAADLSGIAMFEAIGDEAAHLVPGAIQPGGGGAGGGLLTHPGMAGGLRG